MGATDKLAILRNATWDTLLAIKAAENRPVKAQDLSHALATLSDICLLMRLCVEAAHRMTK